LNRRPLGITFGVSLVVVLAGSAVLFASAQATTEVARDAGAQLRAEAALGAAAAARSAIGQSLVLASAGEAGLASRGEVLAATSDLRQTLERLEQEVIRLQVALGEPSTLVAGRKQALVSAGSRIATALEAGNVEEGRVLAEGTFEASYRDFIDLVAGVRDQRELRIATVREGVGEVATAARFLVAFFVPAGAILLLRRSLRQQQQRRELVVRLAQQQELGRSKDEFLAAMSHELRTPLTAVVGFAEVLREGRHNFNAGERNELIELVADQAAETGQIVEDLLVAARADMGQLSMKPEDVDLRQEAEAVTVGWDRHQRARLTIRGTAHAWVDPLRVRQILRNLLINALRHGGDRIEARIWEGTSTVTVEVADNGPGVSAAERERIFEPYHRVSEGDRERATSVGLGLTVARRLARLMDGDLTYRRGPGETVFELTLPAAAHPAELVTEPDTVYDPAAGKPTSAMVMRMVEEGPQIVFQPVVEVGGVARGELRIVGFEALSRFPSGSPPEWFKAAKQAGLLLELELSAIHQAALLYKRLPSDLFLSVNVSDQTLISSQLLEALEGVPADQVVLELSEEAAIKSYDATREAVHGLISRGYRLCFDDVGSGEMDLWHVLRLRPSMIKLDISLVKHLDVNPGNRALTRGLTVVMEDLGATVIAEGLERPEELEAMMQLGVHLGQGFHLGRPSPVEEWEQGDTEPSSQ
jgi:signal transduction histidine kinase/EAL domain-containing protein (putative c-di-GMP-specific phosphodiesterase class I)